MLNLTKTGILKKNLIISLIIYVLIIGTYLGIATTTVNQWRQINIANSPIVFITKTGEKYHQAYHYHGRNYEISLFEADEKGYSACLVCDPPIAPEYDDKPGFYFYNWFFMSIGLTLIYWMAFINRIHPGRPINNFNTCLP